MGFRQICHFEGVILSILFSLLLFQSSGWFLAWTLAQQEARRSAATALSLEGTELELAHYNLSDWNQQIRGKRECWLNNRLYDIRSTTIHGDTVTLQLYHDTREETLLATLGDLLCSSLAACDTRIPSRSAAPHTILLKWMDDPFILPLLPAIGNGAISANPAEFSYRPWDGLWDSENPDHPPKG